jgi:hypothetical protein
MTETITGEVIHVVGPDEHDEAQMLDDLAALAESRYVIVCREGGKPGLFERVWAFLKRDPIRPVTIVADEDAAEGDELTATVHETELPGVYDAIEVQ